MRLSVIIPCYNEVNTVGQIIERIAKLGIVTEIIVVDDGSTDGTRELLISMVESSNPIPIAQLNPEPPGLDIHDVSISDVQHHMLGVSHSSSSILKIVFHRENMGKGAAIRTGLEYVTGDIITIQDADLEYHPEDYPIAIKLIEDGYADAVYGSRFLGPHRCFMVWHYFGNKLLTFLTNVLFNTILTDMETGFKVFRADVLKSLNIRSYTFDFEVEVTAKLCKRGYRLYEIPITYTGRGYEEGKKITWKDGVRALWALVKFRVKD